MAREFLAPVVERFATVYLSGPMWALDGAGRLPALRMELKRAAADTCATFLEASGWLEPRHVGADGAHPTRVGHYVIAGRAAKAIKRTTAPS